MWERLEASGPPTPPGRPTSPQVAARGLLAELRRSARSSISSSDPSTTSARANAGWCSSPCSGTAMQAMEAALAANTPAGASSQTRQRRGAAPSLAAAVRKTAGVRLAPRLVLGRVDQREVVPQAEVLQRGVDEPVLRRRGHGQRQAATGAQGDGVLRARLELAFGQEQGDDPVDDGHRHLGRRRARPTDTGRASTRSPRPRTCPWCCGSRRATAARRGRRGSRSRPRARGSPSR